MYKKISAIVNEEDQEEIRAELLDRFGEIPQVTENLLEVALLKAKAHEAYITEISGGKSEFRISIYKMAPVDTYKIFGFLKSYNEEMEKPSARRVIGEANQSTLRFVAEAQPYFVFRPKHIPTTVPEIKTTLVKFFENLKSIMLTEEEIAARDASEEE